MSTYRLRREIETVATAHAASTGVAKSEAADAIREQLRTAGTETIADLDVEATDIFEFPSGPFDPYRVHVVATVTVTVDAADESAALDAGTDAIADLLAAADLDDVEYVGTAELDASA